MGIEAGGERFKHIMVNRFFTEIYMSACVCSPTTKLLGTINVYLG